MTDRLALPPRYRDQLEALLSKHVPDLPGCVASASTREALLDEIREAIAFHIESLREHGEPVPEPQEATAVVVGADALATG